MSTAHSASQDSQRIWATFAAPLAVWFDAHMVNRRDAFGRYIAVEARRDPDLNALTAKEPLSLEVLQKHVRGASTGDIIGLHSTARDEASGPGEVAACWSRWCATDIDRHDDATDPEVTRAAAIHYHGKLTALGFKCLLLDSNGAGGYHVVVVFDAPVPTSSAFLFMKWLTSDWSKTGLASAPETFPKQAEIAAGGFGNWLRIPGRHHTRDHFTKVWDGRAWLEDAAAIKAILATKGDPVGLIPTEALVVPKRAAKPKRTPAANDLDREANLASDALSYVNHLADDYDSWLRIGMSLTPLGAQGLALWDQWSSQSANYEESACERKWRSFGRSGVGAVTLGTLFHEAKHNGHPGQGKRVKAIATLKVHREDEEAPADVAKPKPKPEPSTEPKPETPKRPDIEISVERHLAVEQAIEALAADPDLYVRGESLVTVVDEAEDTAKLLGGVLMRKTKGSPRIVMMGESSLACHLSRYMRFFTWRKDKSGEDYPADCHPPTWLVRGIAGRGFWEGIRTLLGVTDIPFIRADGTIFSTPGYDPQTGTLLRPSVEIELLPASLTRDDARASAKVLLKLVDQFPFASDDDAVVWVAGVLTGAARPAIDGPTPGVAVNGNRAGTGKGLLIDGAGRLVWDCDVPTTTYPTDPIEAQKVKVAVALAGNPAVNFDNVEEGQSYGNPAIDSAITSREINDRILGTSKNTGRLPLRVCWWLNGNNISPGKDAHRRWLVCNLCTDLERPEERGDIEIPDLRAYISEHRAELVRHILIILKAHADAGYPNDGWAPLGSFEAWDRIVRGAVWYATGRDCCSTRRVAAEEAPERLEKLALLEAWRQLQQGGEDGIGVTVEDAVQRAIENPQGDLHHALMKRSRDGKTPDVRRVGNFIRGMKGAMIGGLKFYKAGEHRRSAMWRVMGTPTKTADRKSCESGESGESSSNPPGNRQGSNSYVNTSGEMLYTNGNGFREHSSDSSDSHDVAVSTPEPGDEPDDDREVFEL